VRHLDDDWATTFVAVSTKPNWDSTRTQRWPDWSGSEMVAATLVQTPNHYVSIDDHLWHANAEFIAEARDDLPRLVKEVWRLRRLLQSVAPELLDDVLPEDGRD